MLNLYNSLTRQIEPFKPTEDMQVKMYTCGPSTYQKPHIGNYRTFLFEDIVQRYMEHLGYKVKRLITLTDVEDKAIDQATKENITIEELTGKNEAIFFEDFKLLKIKMPDYSIKASTAIDQAAKLISKLLENGYAYWYTYKGEKNVYFNPLKFAGFGKLAHLNMDKWSKKKRRFHKDTYPGTPWNLGDFILWHGCEQENNCYRTSIGSGRPAWNIQDAAVVTKHLGFTIDVACGGIDNLVRHHDYTLAIAEVVSGKPFSKYWLHGGHLFVGGKKMSKSKGNVYYPTDILEKGFSSEQLRFFLIYKHYREKLNFTFKNLTKTSQKLESFKNLVKALRELKHDFHQETEGFTSRIVPDFESNMNNDLDVKSAFDNLHQKVKMLYKERKRLTPDDVDSLMLSLHRIDTVLQCIT